jgi:hypothetical protein
LPEPKKGGLQVDIWVIIILVIVVVGAVYYYVAKNGESKKGRV